MGIITWIIFGGVAGWIASKFMHTDDSQGIFANIMVGILGAFIGGVVMSFFGFSGMTGFNIYSFLVAVFGSVVLLWMYGMFTKGSGTHHTPQV